MWIACLSTGCTGNDTSYTFTDVLHVHTILVRFAINRYAITSSAGANGTIAPDGTTLVDYGGSQSYNVYPNTGYSVDSVTVDSVGVGAPELYTFEHVTSSHTLRVTFTATQSYQRMFRTFTYDELPIKKSIAKKPSDDYWEFTVKNTWRVPALQIDATFRHLIWQIVSCGSFLPAGNGYAWTFQGALNPGDSVTIVGRSAKLIHQKIVKMWFDPSTGTPVLLNVLPVLETWEYPMPNVANVREDAFARFTGQSGLVVGIPKPDSARFYGWVRITSAAAMYASMCDRALHTGTPRGFDVFGNARPFIREQHGLSPETEQSFVW